MSCSCIKIWVPCEFGDHIEPFIDKEQMLKVGDPLMLLKVTSEFDIKPAIKLAANACIKSIDVGNVKQILQTAHLHSNTKIKKACFRFVQSNAAQVLTDLTFMALSQEDPDLWSELSKAISPDKESASSKKRARVE